MKALTQGRVLKALHQGAMIRVEHTVNGHKQYRLNTTGQTIAPSLIHDLILAKLIRPNEDGLPGIGEAQTYSLWRASQGGG